MEVIGDSDLFKHIPDEFYKKFRDEIFFVIPSTQIKNADNIDISRCIGVTTKRSPTEIINSVHKTGIPHIVQTDSISSHDEILVALRMLSNSDDFYKNGAVPDFLKDEYKKYQINDFKRIPFSCKHEFARIEKQVSEEISGLPRNEITKNGIKVILNELFSNAIYSAPMEDDYGRVAPNRTGNAEICYNNERKGFVQLGYNDDFLFIECVDPYGSLNPMTIISQIRKSFHIGLENTIKHNYTGGAGIGLRLVYNLSTSCIVCVDKGKLTSICCIIPYRISTRELKNISKNIHVLYSEGIMSSFKYSEEFVDDAHMIHFSGDIDEDSVFDDIKLSQKKKVILDFQNITGINSCGIREWIKLMKTVPSDSHVTCIHCQKEIIDQANMIDGFFPDNTFISSFYIPYFCESCNEQTNILATRDDEPNKVPVPDQETACHNCGEMAEIDIIEKTYFKFIKK